MKKFILPLLLLLAVGMLAAVESAPSAVVGYVKYDCVAGLNLVALPLDAGYTMVSEFADQYPGTMDALSYWDNTTQSWVSAVDWGYWEGDFAVTPGAVLMLSVLSPFSAYSIGDLPAANASYTLLTGLNTVMVPLNRSDIAMAGDIGTEIGTLDAISNWDNATQSWVSAVDWGYWEGDFPVSIGFPLMVSSLSDGAWPVRSAQGILRTSK